MRSVRWMCLPVGLALSFVLGGCSLATAVDRDLIQESPDAPKGVLGLVTTAGAAGWAFDPADPSQPVTVRIEVDGAVDGTVVADELRSDLVSSQGHPTGEAGFVYDFSPALSGGESVSAFIVGTDTELGGSPKPAN